MLDGCCEAPMLLPANGWSFFGTPIDWRAESHFRDSWETYLQTTSALEHAKGEKKTRQHLLVKGNLDRALVAIVGRRRLDTKQRSDLLGWLVEGFRLLHVRVHGFPVLHRLIVRFCNKTKKSFLFLKVNYPSAISKFLPSVVFDSRGPIPNEKIES